MRGSDDAREIVSCDGRVLCALAPVPESQDVTPAQEATPFAPRRYVAYRTPAPIVSDGRLAEPAWAAAPWTDAFVDIEGDSRPRPPLQTRVKMLWDDSNFYVAAEMEEPDLWGTLKQRDAVIFHDNDFEVFIDPDGDTHAYYELEVNVLGTPWDLMLLKPYRDGGRAIDAWDIAGLQVGIDARGTVNRPRDRDDGWTIELAMPWEVLREAATAGKPPQPGEQWRVNFSRVEWQLGIVDGGYAKVLKPGSNQPLPESNWVWSPQGAINMHMPERWGYVQFSSKPAGSSPAEEFVADPNEAVKWALRRLYYRQRAFRTKTGRYAERLAELDTSSIGVDGLQFRPEMKVTDSLYEIVAPGFNGVRLHIDQDGRVWGTKGGPKVDPKVKNEEYAMNRRDFLQHTLATGAVTALSASSIPSSLHAAVKWPVGCFNRPWTNWTFDDALKQIKAAGYSTTGLLTRTKTEPFIGADATPEYLASLKQRIAASGLAANMGALRSRHDIALEESIKETRKQVDNATESGVDVSPDVRRG